MGKRLVLLCSLLFTPISWAADWSNIEEQAKGQEVFFNAWGGMEQINDYIDWAATETEKRYGVKVRHVKITDAAEVVSRIKAEKQAGRDEGGSVDLMWINGENFSAMKQAEALHGEWVKTLPNWQYVDTNKPVEQDFSEHTEGLEAPWGLAQLIFIANKQRLETAPTSAKALLELAQKYPGNITYPKPPAFHGTTFLKQLLLALSDNDAALQAPVDEAAFARLSPLLWGYLDKLHAVAWREGKSFPTSNAEMHQMLADGELLLSIAFNPNEAANLIANDQLPKTAYSFGFDKGTIANVHFLAIPYNARAKAGAQVFTNFLLSPEAQARKADISVWGDPSVLAISKLSDEQQAQMNKKAPGALMEEVPTLAEPHASWVEALEKAWLQRYGG